MKISRLFVYLLSIGLLTTCTNKPPALWTGGAPVNEGFAGSIRADGYSSNANAVVILVRSLVAS